VVTASSLQICKLVRHALLMQVKLAFDTDTTDPDTIAHALAVLEDGDLVALT
jgi:hypothetical protein